VRLILIGSVAATLGVAGAACSSEAPAPAATGGQSATGGSSSTGGSATTGGSSSTGGATTTGGSSSTGGSATTGGSSSGGAGGASGGAAAAPGYAKDVQPFLMAKCGKCHGGQGLGNNNIAVTYADAKRPAESLQFDECWADVSTMTGPKTMGECALLLTRAGKMPAFEACDAPMPPNPSVCLTAAEINILAAWVAGGMAP
jgi:hypothetical protein